ncbi:hypothetical protein WA1_01835 [Scytonema hofmannii PCC 7110]|uniref:Bilirubin oxidase n=1 Tax=Scytonema hofmannii PCC 7110 TaxID=128403 RepID=A0A139XGU9_9CYAN|nr:multicopper oxidase family protein [Scytonema hofmannii]KYC43917.1 hypothetical protein WA1_01835 [Scytonema hofmannii PCC 7110]
MSITRREAIKLGLIASGAFVVPSGHQSQALAQESSQEDSDEFKDSLPMPPLLNPVCSIENSEGILTDYYEIEIKSSQQTIGGKPVEIWGYNGMTPGPLIKQQVGDLQKKEGLRYSVVRFINKLDNDAEGNPIKTVVHLHGMASAPQYDGYADDNIPPAHYKDYIYPNDRAATIWYHDHALHTTERNVQKGLLGMYIVEDEYERKLPLPQGKYDVPLILQNHPEDLEGTTILVNGALTPHFEVERHKYRFRVLNATAKNFFKLTIGQREEENNQMLSVIGTDSGLREKAVDVDNLEMGVGERYEFVIDFDKVFNNGVRQIYLKLKGIVPSPPGEVQPVLRFDINPEQVQDDSSIPDFIRSVKRFDNCPQGSLNASVNNSDLPLECTTEFRFAQSRSERCKNDKRIFEINGKRWATNVACPISGECVVWTILNDVAEPHPVHIHLIDMQLIQRFKKNSDGNYEEVSLDEKPYEANCWKDVFVIQKNEKAVISGKFAKEHRGRYMIHCHNLEHEDCDMMVTFHVGGDNTDPSTLAPAKPVSQMEPLCSVQRGVPPFAPPQQPYDSEAILQYNREVYGPDR